MHEFPLHEFGSLPALTKLVEQRLTVMRALVESLEASTLALVRNDAEGIARGAAHQAELCLQWNRLEGQIRPRVPSQSSPGPNSSHPKTSASPQAEWEAIGLRIRYLTRVHLSLLRHMERSLAVMNRLVNSCAATYVPEPGLIKPEFHPPAGEPSCRV